jgi:hypothetical protein
MSNLSSLDCPQLYVEIQFIIDHMNSNDKDIFYVAADIECIAKSLSHVTQGVSDPRCIDQSLQTPSPLAGLLLSIRQREIFNNTSACEEGLAFIQAALLSDDSLSENLQSRARLHFRLFSIWFSIALSQAIPTISI